jgi:hypothetical protein
MLWMKLLGMENADLHFYYGGAGKTGIKVIRFFTEEFLNYQI